MIPEAFTYERAGTVAEALDDLAATDPPAFERCARELAYLANMLKVGVSVKGESMSDVDAREDFRRVSV